MTGLANKAQTQQGMTLIELTVVILVLLSLIVILFIGARTWKLGSDRATCILNISNVQKGVRGYSNLYGYSPGDTVVDLKDQVIGLGKFVPTPPSCPTAGEYVYGQTHGINTIPPIGTLYMECTVAESLNHQPPNKSEW